MTDALREALAKLDEDLNWRGPTGRTLGHAVLPRALALVVREVVAQALAQRDGGNRSPPS